MLAQIEVQNAVDWLRVADRIDAERNVETTLVMKRLHLFHRTVPRIHISLLGWIGRHRHRTQEEEPGPPTAAIIPRIFCKVVVEHVYAAFVASVDPALDAWARFRCEAIACTARGLVESLGWTCAVVQFAYTVAYSRAQRLGK